MREGGGGSRKVEGEVREWNDGGREEEVTLHTEEGRDCGRAGRIGVWKGFGTVGGKERWGEGRSWRESGSTVRLSIGCKVREPVSCPASYSPATVHGWVLLPTARTATLTQKSCCSPCMMFMEGQTVLPSV